jgi:hypothetical protein
VSRRSTRAFTPPTLTRIPTQFVRCRYILLFFGVDWIGFASKPFGKNSEMLSL